MYYHLEHWTPFLQRYSAGEWRAPIFRDMILADARRMAQTEANHLALLDIGCGCGFDNDRRLQRMIAETAGSYIGVEPDCSVPTGEFFTTVHRCLFEEAPIEEASIDLAFAVMVLEHLEKPELFWAKIHKILKPGGVFWAFTVDARHWFVSASMLTERLGIKDWYLDWLYGRRGGGRYENYQVYYRTNTPEQIAALTAEFSSTITLNFRRVGQNESYFPRPLRWAIRAFDTYMYGRGRPGSLLAVRARK